LAWRTPDFAGTFPRKKPPALLSELIHPGKAAEPMKKCGIHREKWAISW
jgi:hypothetical protein